MHSQKTNQYKPSRKLQVKSAIPSTDLTLNSLPQRSSQPASEGRQCHLYTNHFKCQFPKNLTLYQYDMVVEEFLSNKNQWVPTQNRMRSGQIIGSLLPNQLFPPESTIWHDEKRCFYSTSLLTTPITMISTNQTQQIRILSLTNQWSTNDIDSYINHQATQYPFDAVRILETLLKRSIEDRVQFVGQTCYFKHQKPRKLDGGFEERLGFVQALNLGVGSVSLVTQTKLSTFYPDIPLMEFIVNQLGHSNPPNQQEKKLLNSILHGIEVITSHSNSKHSYEVDGLDHRKPTEILINADENLVEYFQSKYNIRLNQLEYPCIEAYRTGEYEKSCHLPIELCRIKAWQIYDRPLSKAHVRNRPRNSIPTPQQRYSAIMDAISTCNYNSPDNKLCRGVGFRIMDNEMMEISCRVLKQPTIRCDDHHLAQIRTGRIHLHGFLFDPQPILSLAITYFGQNYSGQTSQIGSFIGTLIQVMRQHKIDVQHREFSISTSANEIDKHFELMKNQKYQLVICIMDGNRPDALDQLKKNIKTSGTLNKGVMTQCVFWPNVRNNRSVQSYCEHLIRKINMKNAGINTQVQLNVPRQNPTKSIDTFMFFGADVIHPTNVTRFHPSIAAVVGSGDSLCSTTAARVCRQYPKEGKCSIETILGLKEMVSDLLDYYQLNNQILPNKIVFYRDGVDDGQFGKIVTYEIPLIRQSFNEIYGDSSNHPKLTVIVVKKRHHTRFFAYNREKDETRNLDIGVVVDTTIVHPYQNNFYLNSHQAFQGVNHPSLYHVILDEIGFTTDELQLLTYQLCFTDPRSSASEAIPSVVHQADIAANKARDLFYNDHDSSSKNQRIRPIENPTLNDVTFEMLEVHEDLLNRSVFA